MRNRDAGIDIEGSSNLIAGNTVTYNMGGAGVRGWLTDCTIEGNTIAFNGGSGIEVDSGTGAHISGNTIASNAGPGVWVLGDPFGAADPFGAYSDGAPSGHALLITGIAIQGNSIYANGGLGIALGDIAVDADGNPLTLQQVQADPGLWYQDEPSPGVVLNDSLGHVGPNNYQNYPVLGSASSGSATTVVTGTLNGAADTTFTVDVYASPSADPSGYGQGQYYLGCASVTTDGNGNASFSADLPAASIPGGVLPAGWVVSATATDPGGNTSEFSQDVTGAPATQTFGEYLQATLPANSSAPAVISLEAGPDQRPPTVLTAVSGLTSVTQPVTIILDLGGGTYCTAGVSASAPSNVAWSSRTAR